MDRDVGEAVRGGVEITRGPRDNRQQLRARESRRQRLSASQLFVHSSRRHVSYASSQSEQQRQ